jgi:lysophospholipase L1-like esterase
MIRTREIGYEKSVKFTAMWLLVGVFVLLGGQSGDAGTGNHAQTQPTHADTQARGEHSHRAHVVDRYVAIGDSYTSGAGIPPGEVGGCWRSIRNYPHRIAEGLGARVSDISCGSATTANAEAPQPTDSTENPPQLTPLGRRTDLVTVSLSINDAGFGYLLHQCVTLAPIDPGGAPCRASFQTDHGDALVTAMPAIGDRLEHVLDLVAKRAPRAKVLLVGYPQLVPEQGTCAELPFAAGDYSYVREFFVAVDAMMRGAARDTGSTYIDVLSASDGHDVCAGSAAWVLGKASSSRATEFHPFGNEQRAIAAMVQGAIQEP